MIERFSHPHFLLGHEDLLPLIHRKISTPISTKRNKSDILSSPSTPTPSEIGIPTAVAAAAATAAVGQSQLVESRLVALERQVQFLHLQVCVCVCVRLVYVTPAFSNIPLIFDS